MIKEIRYGMICLYILGAALDSTIAQEGPVALPSFSQVDCPQNKYDFCLDVFFEESEDMIMANVEDPEVPSVLKGFLNSNGNEAVIILKDHTTLEDTIVFKSNKTGGCTRFSTDILGFGETTCLNDGYHGYIDDEVISRSMPFPEDRSMDRSQEQMELSPRALDPNGYKLKVAVYYDDAFDKQFGTAAKTRVHAIMAIVDEMYSEKDTLKTTIKINTIGVKHAVGEDWSGGLHYWRLSVLGENLPTGKIAKSSPYDANLYVFLTGWGPSSTLGMAFKGTVCNSSRGRRISISKYDRTSKIGGDAYTAQTVAHEIGHNLGMDHDFEESRFKGSCKTCYKILDGVACKGYMDYTDSTNYWSHCSVRDFTSYINRQQKFCLESLDGSGSVCVPYSEQACRDAANALGLSLGGFGSSFAGDYSVKGCYAYSRGKFAGTAYYGTGGTTEQMKKSLNGQKQRFLGYDCRYPKEA